MLIRKEILAAIESGAVTLAFRRWRRPTVKSGGSLRTAIGVLAIDSVEALGWDEISEAEARRAGHADLPSLLRELRKAPSGKVYRIALRLAGPDPRIQLRKRASFLEEERGRIGACLSRLDRSSPQGAWTSRLLALLEEKPGLRAVELAKRLGLDKEWLKVKIRRLKELGLTESLPEGYRLSPRGKAWLRSA